MTQRAKDLKEKKFRAEIKEILGFDKLKLKRKQIRSIDNYGIGISMPRFTGVLR